MATIFLMARQRRQHVLIILCGRKNRSPKLSNFQSHSPRYGDALVILFKILLECKMAATDQLHIFLWV